MPQSKHEAEDGTNTVFQCRLSVELMLTNEGARRAFTALAKPSLVHMLCRLDDDPTRLKRSNLNRIKAGIAEYGVRGRGSGLHVERSAENRA